MTRRSNADWQRLIEEHNVSGLSAAEFCRRNGLNAKYFSVRRKKIRGATRVETAFVETTPTLPPGNQDMIDVRVVEFSVPLEQLNNLLSSLR